MCVLSMLMYAIRKQEGEDGHRFNIARYYLAVMFMLTGLSMFVAQFNRGMYQDHFEILNPLMLLFFFLITQGFLWSFFILYASRHGLRQIFNRVVVPVFVLFAGYTLAYCFADDEPIFSMQDFLFRLPNEPMLMARCVILFIMSGSILYCIRLCHVAKTEYHELISGYFSETDFSRSIWLANLLVSGEAVAGWVFMTYFYTTPVLEVIIGILMTLLFAFYVKEFYEYRKRYEYFRPVLLFAQAEGGVIQQPLQKKKSIKSNEEEDKCAVLLNNWKTRADKPFAQKGLTIGDVSRDLAVPAYLISACINRNENNFCSWINELRINEATGLLCREHTLSISEIAERSGFCDLPAFSRAFKKIHHLSPREYRNNQMILVRKNAEKPEVQKPETSLL